MPDHVLRSLTPATDWRDASPLGNGRLGALVHGRVSEEVVVLNDERLWQGGRTRAIPDCTEPLQELRGLMARDEFAAANAVYPDFLRANDWNPGCAAYHPAGDLRVQVRTEAGFDRYRRELDMASAVSTVSWVDGGAERSRESFVSYADGVFAMRLESSRPTTARVRLVAGDPRDVIQKDGTLFEAPIDRVGTFGGGTLHLAGSHRGGDADAEADRARGGFGIVARIFDGSGGAVEPIESGPDASVEVPLDGPLVVLVTTYALAADRDAAVAAAEAKLDELGADWSALRDRHTAAHRGVFLRTTLDLAPDAAEPESLEHQLLNVTATDALSPATLQQMADFGRYLLIGSAGGTTPSHLQGVWNGDHAPPWHCFYMVNENVEMNYWQALTGGLPEFVRGLSDFYRGFMDDFRSNARQLYGCRGIFVPAFITPHTGLLTTWTPHILYWISGAGWLAQHFAELERHFPDPDFREQELVPFVDEAALFLEDFLYRDAAGRLVICPSTSPENVPRNFAEPQVEGGPIVGTVRLTCNATLDIAVARELLSTLLEMAGPGALTDERRAGLERILDELPAYEVNEDGATREWLDDRFLDHNKHRHLSHLYPVFPGREIDALADPAAAEPFRRAMHARDEVGLQQQTGWSLAHMANAAARMGEPAQAVRCLTLLMKTCVGANFFTYHNDYRGSGVTLNMIWGKRPPFQVDANMGLTAAVYEMLYRSRPGRVALLPALPEMLPAGSATGLHGHGGVVVDLSWDRPAARIDAVVHGLPEGTDLAFPAWCPQPSVEHRPAKTIRSHGRSAALPTNQPQTASR